MASKGDIKREEKLSKLNAKFREIRSELKLKIRDGSLSPADRLKAAQQLDALPKNSSRVRRSYRCALTGSVRALSWCGLHRTVLKQYMMKNNYLPGMYKV